MAPRGAICMAYYNRQFACYNMSNLNFTRNLQIGDSTWNIRQYQLTLSCMRYFARFALSILNAHVEISLSDTLCTCI